MPDNTQDGGLAAVPAETPTQAMPVSDNVSADQYAAAQAKKMLERMAKAMPPVESEPEPEDAQDTEPVAESQSGSEEKAPDQPPDDKEQQEGGEEQAETDDEVLSQYEPKTQEKLQKRFKELTKAREEAKAAAEAAAAEKARLQAELERLKADLAAKPTEAEAAPVVIPTDDPNDLTVKASSEAELAKVAEEAKGTLDFIEDNEALIQRAIARDEDVVKLSDGTEYKVDGLLKAKRLAKQQLERYVPQRRSFLQHRNQAVQVAQQKFPGLFRRDTPEYQTFQQTVRQFPQLRSIPNLELMFGYALVGLSAEQAQLKANEATKAVKPASATPPKTGADTAPAVAPVKPKSSSPRKALEEQLARAEKDFEKDGSDGAYQKVQLLRAKLKQHK